jgi:hypothetical protein
MNERVILLFYFQTGSQPLSKKNLRSPDQDITPFRDTYFIQSDSLFCHPIDNNKVDFQL